MGRGLCWALAQAGITVTIKELTPIAAQKSLELLEEELDRQIERWALTNSEKKAILSRIRPTTRLDDLAQASLLIEAVVDHLEQKQEVFESLDRHMPPEQIFISNTSSLSITELAECTKRPQKMVGMHFSMPVQERPLVEIIRGLKTSDETVAIARELARAMGKSAIEVFEYPGSSCRISTKRCMW